ncbi:MAG: mRNA surveillance protein pelota [Nitrososphaerota archaeon]|uniref:mRNA surveillance protein pelota n=1 Tax=Candidatus Bathycorpusculum sp. TaxID=2994959 RepID=UPI002826187B|nr:mRNA surveillance protein pelota [Candidatus Termitimicrobium sp.]MCL2432558.1 mRNA surveillance protein pelota [Candidatus Termitimicrobium sp.]MDR0492571.1 mRNA surveillance protein pelota [Nitrososphaerota archaeon]
MKIIQKDLHQGFLKVVPDTPDDLWHLYNVVYKGDEVYAYSSRAIKNDTEASRPKSGERVSAFMGVKVESVSWDKFLGKLRVHGLIIHAPDIIPTGAHHTLAIALNQQMTIVKKEWPKHLIDRLTKASETEKPLLILSIDDEGFAIAETKQYGYETRVEQRIRLPGKQDADKRVEATKAYFKLALTSLEKLWADNHNPLVIIGAGYVKNDFVTYLQDENKELSKAVVDIKSVNNGGTAGIDEALRSGVLLKTAHQLRIIDETETMEEVMKRLGKGDGNVTYGLVPVENAANMGAIEKLIVADTTLRDADETQRLKLEELMHSIERRQAAITVVSTEHEAGFKLLSLGGIAALLRFPIYQQQTEN